MLVLKMMLFINQFSCTSLLQVVATFCLFEIGNSEVYPGHDYNAIIMTVHYSLTGLLKIIISCAQQAGMRRSLNSKFFLELNTCTRRCMDYQFRHCFNYYLFFCPSRNIFSISAGCAWHIFWKEHVNLKMQCYLLRLSCL